MYPFSENFLSLELGASVVVTSSRIEPILNDFGILDEPDVKQVQTNMRITVKSGSDREVILFYPYLDRCIFYTVQMAKEKVRNKTCRKRRNLPF